VQIDLFCCFGPQILQLFAQLLMSRIISSHFSSWEGYSVQNEMDSSYKSVSDTEIATLELKE